jgi:hypothetical protein
MNKSSFSRRELRALSNRFMLILIPVRHVAHRSKSKKFRHAENCGGAIGEVNLDAVAYRTGGNCR